ncbi:MAG: FxsA family protein [Candidatus Malihini olakiniferum]
MRWLPLFLLFLFAYIEISLFIRVAEVLGIAVTQLLLVFTSCIGIALMRNQGMKIFIQMQQKITARESPAAEMVKSVSLVLASFLLLLPGFFTDFLGLLLLLPPLQKRLTVKLMPHLHIWRCYGTVAPNPVRNTFNGEYCRKDDDRRNIEQKEYQDN